jgi:GT2 family glycosyltransferase
VAYNSAPEIRACLDSLESAASGRIDIVTVDNASSDGTVDIVRSLFPHVTLIVNSTNRYYAAASNQGIAALEGEYVLLLNPDTVMSSGSIDTLCRFLDEHADAAAVAPRLIGPDGTYQPSVREFPGLDTLWYDLTGLAFLFPRSRVFGRWRMGYFDGSRGQIVDQPMASCLMIRREALIRIGMLDERYPMFFNDVDWCHRARQNGYSVYFSPTTAVCHQGGASITRAKVKMIWMGHLAYLRYLHHLHARNPLRRVAVWLSAPFVFLAAVLRSFWWGMVRRTT